MTNHLSTLVVASFSVLAWCGSVQAESLCGGSLVKGSKTAMFLDAGPTVTCSVAKSDPVCHISFTVAEPTNHARPHQGHSLRLFRKSAGKKWIIYLQAAKPLKNLTRMSITVDDNDPMEIPAEFLSFGKKNNPLHAHIDTRLTQVVVDELKKGRKASLTLSYDNPQKSFTSSFDGTTLKNTEKAFDWIDCMQKDKK